MPERSLDTTLWPLYNTRRGGEAKGRYGGREEGSCRAKSKSKNDGSEAKSSPWHRWHQQLLVISRFLKDMQLHIRSFVCVGGQMGG